MKVDKETYQRFIETNIPLGDPDDSSRFLVVGVSNEGLLTLDRKGFHTLHEKAPKK